MYRLLHIKLFLNKINFTAFTRLELCGIPTKTIEIFRSSNLHFAKDYCTPYLSFLFQNMIQQLKAAHTFIVLSLTHFLLEIGKLH